MAFSVPTVSSLLPFLLSCFPATVLITPREDTCSSVVITRHMTIHVTIHVTTHVTLKVRYHVIIHVTISLIVHVYINVKHHVTIRVTRHVTIAYPGSLCVTAT